MRFSLSMLALALLAPLPSLAATAAKDATAATLASNQQWLQRLPFEDRVDYETARRGLVERFDGPVATADGKTVWNLAQYAFLEPAQSPATVNPSLWRIAQLNNIAGLFKVTEGIYQLRGLDLANMTIVEGKDGLIVLDPLLAGIVALNILWSGWRVIHDSLSGLLDESLSDDVLTEVRRIIATEAVGAVEAHDLRTRTAGAATFIEFHLVVPGALSVSQAHDLCDRVEAGLKNLVQGCVVTIHVEPEFKAKHSGIVVL